MNEFSNRGDATAVTAQPLDARPKAHVHVGELDGIRGFAALLVVAHHLTRSLYFEFDWNHPLLRIFKLGWVGVDLFFVLSGYLITGILLDAKSKPSFFKNFYGRRSLRIFPLYYLALIVFGITQLIWPLSELASKESLAWVWVYATNILMSIEGRGDFGALGHFWSLAVEEHFYLVWPFVVLVCTQRTLFRVCIAILVGSFLVRLGLVAGEFDPDAAYVLTPARIDALAIGGLLTMTLREKGIAALLKPARLVAAISALVFLGLVIWRGRGHHDEPWLAVVGLSALGWLGASVIAIARNPGLFNRIFNWSWLRFFGKYSYGLYVWHPMLFILAFHSKLAQELRGEPTLANILLSILFAFASSALVTALSWTLVERRFLRLKSYFD